MERSREEWTAPDAPDDSSGDYIQDPDLVVDRLPQPFRMIDGLLQDLLSITWDEIETRQLQRETERTRVRIPRIVIEAVVEGVSGVHAVNGAGRDTVLIGSQDGVRLTDSQGKEIAFSSTNGRVISLAVEQMANVYLAVATTESGATYLLAGLHSASVARLVQLAEIPPSQDSERKPVAVHIAPLCSHVALITSIEDADCQVECYQLPKSAWTQQLAPFLEEPPLPPANSGENIVRASSSTDTEFSKPSHLYVISPPKPLVPCSSSNQHTALENVFGSGEVIATGEHHMLSGTYLEKRRQAFEAERCGFTQPPSPPTTDRSSPNCHFLYFRNSTRQEEPSSVLVWWTGHTQIHFYSLSSKGSSPMLDRVMPHCSHVCVTAVSCCARYLAVGLESGVVTIWDLKTNFCRSVQRVVHLPDKPTALMFYSPTCLPTGPPGLTVGTKRGSVLLVKPDLTTLSLSQRLCKQQEIYKSLFDGSGYDSLEIVNFIQCPSLSSSVIVSVHVDGSLILWSTVDLEAVCKVVLPSSSLSPLPAPVCAFTGDSIFVAGPDGHAHYLRLSSVKYLKRYLHHPGSDSQPHRQTSNIPQNLMDNIQLKLEEFNVTMYRDNDVFQATRTSKWDNYLQHLQLV